LHWPRAARKPPRHLLLRRHLLLHRRHPLLHRRHPLPPPPPHLLPRRPEQSFCLDLDRDFGDIRAGGTVYFAGRTYDEFANRIRLDAYALVDLRAEYDFTKSLKFQGRIENLFDEDYETAAYYNQPGRSAYLTLRYEP